MNKPIYTHDCTECEYLGRYIQAEDKYQPITEYDLYAHKRAAMIELFARYGNNQADYLSGGYFLGYPEEENTCLQMPIYKEIFDRYNEKHSNLANCNL